jgi:FkbM family methyltransferase
MYLRTVLANGARVYGKNKSGYGGRGVYLYGDDIEPELNYLDKFLDKESVFIDIGASSGIYTLKAAKHLTHKGIVIAVEPFPEVFNSLYFSVRKNGFNNVKLRNFCATKETSETTLWMNSNLPNTFSIVERHNNSSGLSVLGVSIDDLMVWEKLNRLDYIKIDAEGAEKEILLGAKKSIEKFRPIIQAEITVRALDLKFDSYVVFKAPNSLNVVFVPKESNKLEVAKKLGWKIIS